MNSELQDTASQGDLEPEASCETTKLGFFDISVVFPIVTDVYGELGIRNFGAAEPFTMPYYFIF